MTVIIKHSVVTHAVADPTSLVDGPAWDATHVVSGLATSATTDTTNASNIISGTLPAAQLPVPTSSSLGGVKSLAAQTHQFLTQIGTDGLPAQSQPAFTDISGTAAIAQGGTGQITASSSFDALSPTTTRGDIVARGASSNGRLAVGTSGYALLSNGTDPAWAGFLQAGSGAVARTWQDKERDFINVKDFGATGNGSTDDTAAIQAAINAFPNGAIYFGDSSNTYKCTSAILLVDASGHNFQGRLIAAGATVTFTNAGVSSDADSAMQHGFQAYPVTNGTGGDITGARNVVIEGFSINCPTNGAGVYLANSQRCSIINNTFTGGRYGVATECCINTYIYRNTFTGFINAGVGIIYSGDTHVWYGGSGTASYWNDSPQIIGNGFSGTVTGGLAHILDMGGNSESIRNIQGNYLFSNVGCNKYGYLARNANPIILSNWTENVSYPIRFLNSNAAEGGSGTTLTGVTAAQPSGTFTVGAFPDGFSYTARVENNYFARAVNDINMSGVTGGPSQIGGNVSQLLTGFHLVSAQSGSQKIMDSGDTLVAASGGVYSSLAFPTWINLAGIVPWTAYAPTVSTSSGTLTTKSATGKYCIDAQGTTFFQTVVSITTNGTGAGSVNVTLPSTPTAAHTATGRDIGVSGKALSGSIAAASATMSVFNYDFTYPGANGALFVINGFYT